MNQEAIFEKKAWSSIFSLSIPALISILVMVLYNMADMYFVGWLNDVTQVAAVALAAPVFSVLMAVSTMLGNGALTKIAQALGQSDTEGVRRYTAMCVWGSIGFGLIFTAACFLGITPLLRFLGAEGEMWDYTRRYILIMAAGAPVVLLNHTVGSALRGEGEVKMSLAGSMISTFTNIILDPIFILALGFGVSGAAAATVLGNAAAVGYYLLAWKLRDKASRRKDAGRSRFILELRPSYACDIRELCAVLALGLPNAVSTTLGGLAGSFGNRLLSGYGTGAVAAMAAASKASMVVTMVQMGICMGVMPLLAYCYGGGDKKRLREIAGKLLFLTAGLGTVLTIAIYAGRGALIGLFIQDPEVAALGTELSVFLVLSGPVVGIYYLCANLLQAAGRAMAATFASAMRQGILLIPLLYLMNVAAGLHGIALAYLLADAVSIVVTAGMAVHCFKEKGQATEKILRCYR